MPKKERVCQNANAILKILQFETFQWEKTIFELVIGFRNGLFFAFRGYLTKKLRIIKSPNFILTHSPSIFQSCTQLFIVYHTYLHSLKEISIQNPVKYNILVLCPHRFCRIESLSRISHYHRSPIHHNIILCFICSSKCCSIPLSSSSFTIQ